VAEFPSVEWFAELRDLVNRDEGYRKLGTCEACAAFQIGQRCFEVVFDAFRIENVREITPAEAQQTSDFILEMGDEDWREMVENIRANRGADPQHTLNTLVFPGKLKLRYRDAFGMDKFYLYNQSLQYFLNAASRLEH
jgi:hypothetical protein